jgi:O-antigen/teichoic acid export membrane protein
MDRLTRNILASFFSKGWSALLSLVCVPFYVKFLGVEAYGVIGVFVTMQAALSLLDLGLGAAFTREVAQISHKIGSPRNIPDLLRTLEVIYWIVALVMAIVIWGLGPVIAKHWLRLGILPSEEVGQAIGIAGFSFAVLWPTSLYSGGLTGLHRQVLLGWITSVAAVLRVGGALLALWLVSPTLKTFFLAQAGANLFQTIVTGLCLWRCLPQAGAKAAFRIGLVRVLARFAIGMTGISVTSVVLTQLDKLILSKTLPLEVFGYYVIAGTLASGLYIFISPLFGVLFPKFSQLVAQGDRPSLVKLYHIGCQLMTVLVLPVAVVMVVFAKDLLRLWTHDANIAASGALILSLIVVGNALNGLINVPYAVQLAYGWTNLALYTNIVAIAICAPTIYFLSIQFGAVAAALVWVALTFCMMLTHISLSHRKYVLGSQLRWYTIDVGKPALAAISVVVVARLINPHMASSAISLLFFGAVTVIAGVAAIVSAPDVRTLGVRAISELLKRRFDRGR